MNNPPDATDPSRTWRSHWPAVLMLVMWCGLAIHTCRSMSVTFDEIWHLPVGVRNLRDGDFAEDRLNPPLSRMWAAIPLVVRGVAVSPSTPEVQIGERFVAEHDDFQYWYVAGRYFNLLWPLATSLLLYRVVLTACGVGVARLALGCLLCCPDLIAHGSVVTPDTAAMFFFFAVSISLASWCDLPDWRRTLLLGITLGLLQAVKYTGVVFLPVFAILALWLWLRPRTPEQHEIGHGGMAARVIAVLVMSLLSLAACYRFQGLCETWGSLPLQSLDMQTIRDLTSFLAGCPVPVPRDFLLGLDAQRAIMESPHPTFLDGDWSLQGFRSYFLYATAYKMPLMVLGLAVPGMIALSRHSDRQQSFKRAAYVFPVGILVLIASFSSMQLGFRYVMPVLPLLAYAAGGTWLWLRSARPAIRMGWLGIMIAGLLSVWRYHPHHLSYFNELAGGPIGGRQHLVDSNIDWGQDLLRAREVYEKYGAESPGFAYFGTVNPQRVGIPTVPPPSFTPQPGVYLVSVNYVMGRPGTIREADGQTRSADVNAFEYFRLLKPLQHVGYSIDLYRVTEADCDRLREIRDSMP